MSAEPENELAAVFRNATYIVSVPTGELHLHIGVRSPAMQRLLEDCSPPCAAIITAYNPNAIKQSHEANDAAQAQLLSRLHRQGFRHLTGHNCAPGGSGPVEPTAVVLGVTKNRAEQLGRDFGQAAIVYIESAEPQLLWLC